MTSKSPSERADALTLRIVGGVYRERLHLCLAHPSFIDGGIVTLEALCTAWTYDVLSYKPIEQWRQYFPQATMCPACWVKYKWLPL